MSAAGREQGWRGLNAELHATGVASVRMVLDAVAAPRAARGRGPVFQIAHAEWA